MEIGLSFAVAASVTALKATFGLSLLHCAFSSSFLQVLLFITKSLDFLNLER